ncbi:Rne/Rng family ribonuclease [Kocuria sp. M1R5S2]|uniref:Rne/Rng family ribonuclease n=1 Tax=Kocuria rhizosphaerae TaxID=3376285 RepID=UPI0037A28FE1
MDAEQVNQDGAQDALDAGQQNTSTATPEQAPAEGTAQETAVPAGEPDEAGDDRAPEGQQAGETPARSVPSDPSVVSEAVGPSVAPEAAELPEDPVPTEDPEPEVPAEGPGSDETTGHSRTPDGPEAAGSPQGLDGPEAAGSPEGPDGPGTPGASASGDISGTDTLDVAPGSAVPGDETPGAVAAEATPPHHPAPGTPGGEDAAEGVEPAGEDEDRGPETAAGPEAPAAGEPTTGGHPHEGSAQSGPEHDVPADAPQGSAQVDAPQGSAQVDAPRETRGVPQGEAGDDGADEEEPLSALSSAVTATSIMFHAPDLDQLREAAQQRAARRKEARRRQQEENASAEDQAEGVDEETAEATDEGAGRESGGGVTSRRRRRRRRGDTDMELVGGSDDDPPNTVTRVRAPRGADTATVDEVVAVKGSTRLEAKKQRRRESRQTGRRRQVITEAEFLARRESVERQMLVRQTENRIQIGVLEDGVLAEHFVSHTQQDSLIGNVYVGKVQNVLPSMEAAFVDIGRGRNAVLYAGEVNWDASRVEGGPRRIENALKSGDSVLVQVTKDPVGHKGARLTSQISLPGRYLVYVPGGSMTGISRKLPDVERARLKKILKDRLPDGAGVIVRTAAEGASEQELTHDINRLRAQWEQIQERSGSTKTLAPEMLYAEPDLTIKTVRDVFNEDFTTMVVQGDEAWDNIEAYVTYVAPDLLDRLRKWEEDEDLFVSYRVEEQIQKALDRKVFLPSGGSLVIDRTEAMTVVDVNTGKFTGSGGNLEETVTKNNLEAAEEIVRQLRLRDIGGIIVIDFIDMVLESNRDLVLRRLVECLGRDRTKHQVAEVTSLGLVQMTRKRMGTGLLEVFSEPCEHCAGRGVVVHDHPLEGRGGGGGGETREQRQNRTERKRGRRGGQAEQAPARHESPAREPDPAERAKAEAARTAFATIAAATHHEPQAEEARPQAEEAPAAEARPEGAGRSRKKRRGKRSRNRGQNVEATAVEGAAVEGAAPDQQRRQEPAEERARAGEDSGEPAAEGSRLTIKGEVIELPQGQAEETEVAPRLSLDSLAQAFGQPGAHAEPAEETEGARPAGAEETAGHGAVQPAPAAQPTPVAQQAEPSPPAEPARARRRSRRASAPAGTAGQAEVTAGRAAAAEGARHEAGPAARRPEDAPERSAPTVVGVGVKAADLTSGRPTGQG